MADNQHLNKGLRYALERDRTAGMDEESLELQVHRPTSTPTEAAAAREELLERHDS